ncbi:MAG: SCO family protein [Rhodocyclaceae bacterium]|nr:SCO family protein [Rhodocyclaceae bacterium]
MKRAVLLACCVGFAVVAHASPEAGLSAVRDLGRLNGQALACGNKDTAAWVKILMLNHAPKTRTYGEAYEEGTQEAFAAHGRGAPCAERTVLAARLDAVTQRLKIALPVPGLVPQGHSQAESEPNAIVPRYLLQDPNGRAVTNEDFLGHFQLITFGYTSCPDVCPTTLLEMKEVLKALGDKAAQLQPIFITVDPERDSAQVLREYTSAFDPRILGLGGSEELIRRAAAEFKVRYEKVRDPAAPPGSYTVDHSAGMILLGPDGRAVVRFAYATPAKQMAERIEALMQEGGLRPSR